jgi:hypothetical protein
VRHGVLFHVRVTATDGRKAAVTVQVDDHPREVRPYVLNDVADRLRVDRAEVLDVLANWTPERLLAHLECFSSDELKPPSFRR